MTLSKRLWLNKELMVFEFITNNPQKEYIAYARKVQFLYTLISFLITLAGITAGICVCVIKDAFIGGIIVAVFVACLILSAVIFSFRMRRTMYDNSALKDAGAMTLQFDERSVTAIVNGESFSISASYCYQHVRKIKESRCGILVIFSDGATYRFTKEDIDENTLAAWRELMTVELGRRYSINKKT